MPIKRSDIIRTIVVGQKTIRRQDGMYIRLCLAAVVVNMDNNPH
jgi:ribosomal protein L14